MCKENKTTSKLIIIQLIFIFIFNRNTLTKETKVSVILARYCVLKSLIKD